MTDRIRVLVRDVDVDAALMDHPDGQGKVLVLRPGQSFCNAVDRSWSLLPHLRHEQVRDLVRQYLPVEPDLVALLDDRPFVARHVVVPMPVEGSRRERRRGAALVVAAAVIAGVMGTGVGLTLYDDVRNAREGWQWVQQQVDR